METVARLKGSLQKVFVWIPKMSIAKKLYTELKNVKPLSKRAMTLSSKKNTRKLKQNTPKH
jgi:hypothetical protein